VSSGHLGWSENWDEVQDSWVPWCVRRDAHVRKGVPFVVCASTHLHVWEAIDEVQWSPASLVKFDMGCDVGDRVGLVLHCDLVVFHLVR
jgi:hypothetical protein